ncbi:MAG: hypothetical protein ACOYIR_00700 [Christensenellales bacterium]|jgi:ABC-2 type transport system permease protein
MRNVYLLVKVGLSSALGGATKKKRRLKAGLLGVTALFGGLLFMAFMGIYGYMISMMLDFANTPELLLSGGLALGLLMSFFTGVMKIPGVLFAAKDFGMLASLPVTNTQLFLSKLVLAYTFSMTGIGGISLPYAIVYGIKYGASFGFYLAVLAGVLIAPLLVCAVAGVFSIFISRIAAYSRASNLIMLVLSLALIVLIMLGSMTFSSMPDSDLVQALTGYSAALSAFLPTGLYTSAALGAYGDLIWLLLICGVPFALFATLSARVFRRANLAMGERRTHSNFKAERLGKIGGKSVSAALFSRELRGYFSFYGYVMNTAAGALLALIFTGLLIFGGKDMFAAAVDPSVNRTVILPTFVAMLCYCGVLAPPTASGISIEGNRLWILRSLPVLATDIFKAKLKLQLLIMWPVCVIAGAAASIALGVDALNAALTILVPMAYALLSGLVGLVTNLLMPMLNWKNPMVPIKRSGSVIVCMVTGFASLAIPIAIYLLVGVDFTLFAALVLAAVLIACALIWQWLKTVGSRKFYAL